MPYELPWFLEASPEVEKFVTRGKAEGIAEGEAKGLRKAIVILVRSRFPSLVSLARKRISGPHAPGELDVLMQRLIVAPDEESVRKLCMRNDRITERPNEMLYVRDWFIETLPEVKKLVAQSKADGRDEGLCLGLQDAIVEIVWWRFPQLSSLAEQSVSRIHASSQLEALIQHLAVVSDEESTRKLLREIIA